MLLLTKYILTKKNIIKKLLDVMIYVAKTLYTFYLFLLLFDNKNLLDKSKSFFSERFWKIVIYFCNFLLQSISEVHIRLLEYPLIWLATYYKTKV